MKIVILRLNTGDFGKIGTYNVQEVGIANALIKMGHKVNVLFLHRNTTRIIEDETYNFVYYLPHKTFLMHGIFNTNLLDKFAPERVILVSDNQLWAKNVILWCKAIKFHVYTILVMYYLIIPIGRISYIPNLFFLGILKVIIIPLMLQKLTLLRMRC